jgi:phosphatidate cytidylyltransferase
MAQMQASAKPPSSLKVRVISALVMAPLALVIVWAGGWALAVFTAAAGIFMSLEWARLTSARRSGPAAALLIAVLLGALLAASLGSWAAAAGLVAGAGLTMLLAGLAQGWLAWTGLGLLYVGLPCLAFLWLRILPEEGLQTLFWVLALVWAVDSGAYFAGRAIGGPKLARQISPNKTWAGLGGGVGAALLVGIAAAALAGTSALWVALVSAGLAFVEQAGDLMESAIKRHFNAKDAGRLIPGHGGLLDRVDGLIATLMAVAALTLAAGRSPLFWQ